MKKGRCILHIQLVSVLFLLTALAGCGVRSISDSGYRAENGGSVKAGNPLYSGELSEFTVLGIDPAATVTLEEINRFLAKQQKFTLPKGSSLMLVQSGALLPDEEMLRALEQYYNVTAFSGVPIGRDSGNYAMSLRLAAARSGCEKIMVYWGILETAQKNKSAKVLSWMPLVGSIIPDESQKMRIRLKVALVDVKTGQWDAFSPQPFQDSADSARYERESVDQGQVTSLKAKAYADMAEKIAKKYAD